MNLYLPKSSPFRNDHCLPQDFKPMKITLRILIFGVLFAFLCLLSNVTNAQQGVRPYPNPIGGNCNVLFLFWDFIQNEFDIQVSGQTARLIQTQRYFF